MKYCEEMYNPATDIEQKITHQFPGRGLGTVLVLFRHKGTSVVFGCAPGAEPVAENVPLYHQRQ